MTFESSSLLIHPLEQLSPAAIDKRDIAKLDDDECTGLFGSYGAPSPL